jgi:hypothetical protein
MMAKLDEINGRLIEIAQRMDKTEIVNMFNNRNEKYYNKLKVQNTKYFDDAYNAYKANKNDPELAQYGKAWVGRNEEFANLTWEYIEYLTTVEHTGFGKGMDHIYDGLVFNKYPWEHIGIGDRKSYRAYDLTMIAKSLFMISLYSTYGGLSNIEQKGLYKLYKTHKPQLKAFSEFKVSNPNKFLVCQIPGAHFIMHKEIQKYNYRGKDGAAPNPTPYPNRDAVYRPEWHEAGSIKIENPKELKEKLIRVEEAVAFHKYYQAAVFSNQERIWWTKMLVGADDNKLAAGAVLAKQMASPNNQPYLMLSQQSKTGMSWDLFEHHGGIQLMPVQGEYASGHRQEIGRISKYAEGKWTWDYYEARNEYYAAIVEKRF